MTLVLSIVSSLANIKQMSGFFNFVGCFLGMPNFRDGTIMYLISGTGQKRYLIFGTGCRPVPKIRHARFFTKVGN